MKQEKAWAGEEKEFVLAKLKEGWNCGQIGRELGRTGDSVRGLLRRNGILIGLTLAAVHREEKKSRLREQDKNRRKYNGSRSFRLGSPRAIVPEFVIEEREARYAEQRDLTAILLGDPVPSRSALARRIRAESQEPA